jgi:hypothetical protein
VLSHNHGELLGLVNSNVDVLLGLAVSMMCHTQVLTACVCWGQRPPEMMCHAGVLCAAVCWGRRLNSATQPRQQQQQHWLRVSLKGLRRCPAVPCAHSLGSVSATDEPGAGCCFCHARRAHLT